MKCSSLVYGSFSTTYLCQLTVMLNENGYCVVVDMGFAKVVMDKTYTMCG